MLIILVLLCEVKPRKFATLKSEKNVGMTAFFEKSYKNTRTKNSVSHLGYAIFDAPGGTRKGVKKTCQWHVFSPWESPFPFQTRPVGVWTEWKRPVSTCPIWDTLFLMPRRDSKGRRQRMLRAASMAAWPMTVLQKTSCVCRVAICFLTIPVSWLPSGFSLSVFDIYCQEL